MNFTLEDAKAAILELAKIKGAERAKLIERILRLETKHFKSKQYKLTGSAGMEKGKWQNLDEDKMQTIQMLDNHPEKVKVDMRTFLVWNSVLDFCLYLSDYIDRYDGNFGRWNSTNPTKQKAYEDFVNKKIRNRFIN